MEAPDYPAFTNVRLIVGEWREGVEGGDGGRGWREGVEGGGGGREGVEAITSVSLEGEWRSGSAVCVV